MTWIGLDCKTDNIYNICSHHTQLCCDHIMKVPYLHIEKPKDTHEHKEHYHKTCSQGIRCHCKSQMTKFSLHPKRKLVCIALPLPIQPKQVIIKFDGLKCHLEETKSYSTVRHLCLVHCTHPTPHTS